MMLKKWKKRREFIRDGMHVFLREFDRPDTPDNRLYFLMHMQDINIEQREGLTQAELDERFWLSAVISSEIVLEGVRHYRGKLRRWIYGYRSHGPSDRSD